MWSNLPKITLSVFTILMLLDSNYGNCTAIEDINDLIRKEAYQEVIDYTDSLMALNPSNSLSPEIIALRADAFYYLQDIENSLDTYLAVLHAVASKEIDYYSLVQEVHSYIGFCYRELGLFDKALPHYLKSLEMADQMKDSVEYAIQAYNLGTVFFKLGELSKATDMLNKAYQIDLARKDTSALGFDLSLMTDLKVRSGDLKQALIYSKESLQWLRKEGSNANSLAMRLKKIGAVFHKKGMLDSASYYFSQAEQELIRVKDSIRLATLWINQAQVEIDKKNYSKGVSLALEAKFWHIQSGYSSQVSAANLVVTRALIASGQFEEAEKVLNENLRVTSELTLLDDMRETYFLQSELYDELGHYRLSKNALVKFQQLNDSILSIEEKERIKHLELTFKFDKIEHENEVLRLKDAVSKAQIEKDRVQIMWLIISLIITLIGSIVVIRLMYIRFKLKRKLLMSEVNELRAQIKILLEGDTSDLGLDSSSLNSKLNEPLSDREFEILQLAISDLNNSQIAEKIFVSVNTVKFHLKNVYHKLGVSNRKQALEYVIKTK
ncbi:MAG: tetratricopeptide repeat protein [Reichenbachiella sp.]